MTWIQHRYRYYILYCNFYITLKFFNIFSIVFGIIKITTVCIVFGLRVTETVHGFLYHSFVHALRPRKWSFSVQVSISAIVRARVRSTTVSRTLKFVLHGENGEQGRAHCCRTATDQSRVWKITLNLLFWFDFLGKWQGRNNPFFTYNTHDIVL